MAEYTYNGLSFRITEHTDTDLDGDVDSNDDILHFMYDDGWRLIATFRKDDSDPKEYFTYHAPGIGGDRFVLRDKDADTDWTAASDGTLEERIYYVQNWRGDVVNLLTDAGAQVESVRYSAYGVPFGIPAGDVDLDGDVNDGVNTDDTDQIQTWINGATYDVRGDLDLDGDVDATDKALAANNAGAVLGRNELSESALAGTSSSATGNRFGVSGGLWIQLLVQTYSRSQPALSGLQVQLGRSYSDMFAGLEGTSKSYRQDESGTVTLQPPTTPAGMSGSVPVAA